MSRGGSMTIRSLLLVVVPLLVSEVSGKVRRYNFELTYGHWSPDCVRREFYLTNGQYPGPTITALVGDTVKVTVFNRLFSEAVAIHWHGLYMKDNNLYDGSAHVTQCPIGPLEHFTYVIYVDRPGTFIWHGHAAVQATGGLYGMFVVYDTAKPVPYFKELRMSLTDHWHAGPYEGMATEMVGEWVGQPQSLLINGMAKYNCSEVPGSLTADHLQGDIKPCNPTAGQCGRYVWTVRQGKTYRMRIMSIATFSSMNLVFEKHKLTVFQADSYRVKPFVVGDDGLDVYTGQTYDVIFTADQVPGNYWVRTAIFNVLPYTTAYGLAIINYEGIFPMDPTTPPPPFYRGVLNVSLPAKQQMSYKALLTTEGGDTPPPPSKKADVFHVFDTDLLYTDFQGGFTVNNLTLVLPATPFALGIAAGLDNLYQLPKLPTYPAPFLTTYYYKFPLNSVVDIVIQGSLRPIPGGEWHPWHIHGHYFYIVAQGFGQFDPKKDLAKWNLKDPPLRQSIPPLPQGWVAVRFIADNPGAWQLHCHIEYHLFGGMGIVFVDGHVLPKKRVPKNFPLCGQLPWNAFL